MAQKLQFGFIQIYSLQVKVKDVDKGQIVISIASHENSWETRRTWSQTVSMDEQFHECVISRATTKLQTLIEVPFLRHARSSVSLLPDDFPESRPIQRVSQSKVSRI